MRTTRLDKPQGVTRYSVYPRCLTWRTALAVADLGFPVTLRAVCRKPRATPVSSWPPEWGESSPPEKALGVSCRADPIHFATTHCQALGKRHPLPHIEEIYVHRSGIGIDTVERWGLGNWSEIQSSTAPEKKPKWPRIIQGAHSLRIACMW